jgi:hypothetical protein
MKWWILSTQQPEDWYNSLRRLSQFDIYFLPEYHRAYELNGDGRACAFVAEEGNQVLFYPFLMRSIERVGSEPVREPCYDIETVYGYSGPLCTTTDPTFLAGAWAAFSTWCQESHIIAEFVRFNPLIGNYCYMDPSGVVLDRETVMVNLDCSEEELWESYPSVQRNMVRKAMKKGMICEEISPTEGLSVFKSLYGETMNRLEADQYYHFSDDYFNHISSALGEKIDLFVVRDKGRVVAAALFFLHDDRIHYHLAGSDVQYRKYAPNNLLLHTVAQWGRKRGFHWLHLGGGRTADPNDALFHFKASISRLRLPFHIGKRVHNRDVYERLCTEWMRQKSVVSRPSYFLLYRLG